MRVKQAVAGAIAVPAIATCVMVGAGSSASANTLPAQAVAAPATTATVLDDTDQPAFLGAVVDAVANHAYQVAVVTTRATPRVAVAATNVRSSSSSESSSSSSGIPSTAFAYQRGYQSDDAQFDSGN